MNETDTLQQMDELRKVIDELIELNTLAPVIVEGDKDVSALRSLGLEGSIIKINTGLSILNTCERISRVQKSVIILTDWDRKGGTIARRLKDSFASLGVKTNLDIRAKLAVLCKKDIKDVESIYRYISRLQTGNQNK